MGSQKAIQYRFASLRQLPAERQYECHFAVLGRGCQQVVESTGQRVSGRVTWIFRAPLNQFTLHLGIGLTVDQCKCKPPAPLGIGGVREGCQQLLLIRSFQILPYAAFPCGSSIRLGSSQNLIGQLGTR